MTLVILKIFLFRRFFIEISLFFKMAKTSVFFELYFEIYINESNIEVINFKHHLPRFHCIHKQLYIFN